MGQRTRILTEILGFGGWKVQEAYFEDAQGRRFEPVEGYGVMPDARLVLRTKRQWLPHCSQCGAKCRAAAHERLRARRWEDLPWAGHPSPSKPSSSGSSARSARRRRWSNRTLGRAYQIQEELRETLHAPGRASMEIGLRRLLRRTQERSCKPLRKLHDSLIDHWEPITALGEHRPRVGRVEALNNNWESLVRRARGYRDHQYLLLKLRFMTANPVRTKEGTARFIALGLPVPMKAVA